MRAARAASSRSIIARLEAWLICGRTHMAGLAILLTLHCTAVIYAQHGQRELTTTDCLGAPKWTVGAGPNPHAIAVCDGPGAGSHCLDIKQAFAFRGAKVWLWPCSGPHAPGLVNENWLSAGSVIRSLQPNTTTECLAINASGHGGHLTDCTSPAAAIRNGGAGGGAAGPAGHAGGAHDGPNGQPTTGGRVGAAVPGLIGRARVWGG